MTTTSPPGAKSPAPPLNIANMKPEDLLALQATARNALAEGHSLAEKHGVSADEIKARFGAVGGLCDKAQFAQALPGALELLLLVPGDWRSAFLVGTCLQRLNRPSEALPFYSWVLAQSALAAAQLRMGECHSAMGESEAALEAFLDVLTRTEEADPVHKLATAAAPLLAASAAAATAH